MAFTIRIEGEEVRLPFDETSFVAGRASCRFEEQVDKMVAEDAPPMTQRFVAVSMATFLGLNRYFTTYARARNVSVAKRATVNAATSGERKNVTLVLTKRAPGHFNPLTEQDD